MKTIHILHWTELPHESEINHVLYNEDFREYSSEHGFHFTDRLADYVTKHMVPVDDASSPWTTKQVRETLQQNGVKLKDGWTWGDASYIMNMAKMDFYPALLKTNADVITYTKMVMEDPDGYDEISFSRWLSDVSIKGNEIDWECYI